MYAVLSASAPKPRNVIPNLGTYLASTAAGLPVMLTGRKVIWEEWIVGTVENREREKKRPTGYYRVRVGKEEMRLGEQKGGRIVKSQKNDVEPGKRAGSGEQPKNKNNMHLSSVWKSLTTV